MALKAGSVNELRFERASRSDEPNRSSRRKFSDGFGNLKCREQMPPASTCRYDNTIFSATHLQMLPLVVSLKAQQ